MVRSAKASRGFDNILPSLATQVEDQLIRTRPDLHDQITTAVEAVALKLATRRAELDDATARVWAKAFTEDELKTIAAFYKTSAGAKFAEVGGTVYSDTMAAVQQWSDRVGSELLEDSRTELKNEGVPVLIRFHHLGHPS
ncbi:MAG: DUF2059 domain-containing protein [Bauldia sp.]